MLIGYARISTQDQKPRIADRTMVAADRCRNGKFLSDYVFITI
jgi:hypothetical protein